MKKYCFSSQDLLFQILSRPHVHVIKQTEILLLNNNKTNFINDIDWAKNIWYTWRNFLCVLTDSKYTFRTIDFSSKMTQKKRWKYKEIIKSSEVPEHHEAKRTFHFVPFFRKVYLDIIYAAVSSNSLKGNSGLSFIQYSTEIFKFSAEIRKNDAKQIGVRNHKQMVKALFIMPHDGQYWKNRTKFIIHLHFRRTKKIISIKSDRKELVVSVDETDKEK